MKKLIMCEGHNELAIFKILLENDMLCFGEDDLLGLTPYHARQIAQSGQVKAELNQYMGQVEVLRIGDKQSDILKIPKEYKDYAKSNIKYNGIRYDNSTKFFEDYFGSRPQELYKAIKEYYKKNKGHKKEEGYLAELLL